MSAADYHRNAAAELLADFPATEPGISPGLELASAATAHALLAVEARLGELVEQQRTAVMIAAFQSSAIRNDRDYIAARDAVRRVLDLDVQEGGTANE